MEAIMRNTIKQLIIGMAVAVGLSAVGVSTIGGAVAQSAVEKAPVVGQDAVIGGYEFPGSETGGRLGDRQQLRGYFLNGARDWQR
jgi:hypothetical protein